MELHFRKYGENGPALLILHGLLGSHGNWSTLSRHVFSDAFQVYAIDQRNHGRSPHSGPFDYGDLADDLRDFSDQQGLDTFFLLGHSMGGKTAMEAALRYPEMVSGLIVADMAPRAYEPAHEPLLEAIAHIQPSEYDTRSAIDRELERTISDKSVRQFVLKNLDRQNGSYTWQMNHRAIRGSYEALIAELRGGRVYDGPSLFLKGEQSPYISEEDEPQIKAIFPKARIESVEGAGHWLHADNPEDFAKAVMSFLRDKQ